MKSSNEPIKDASTTDIARPSPLAAEKIKKKHEIETGKLKGSLTALKIIFGLIALVILMLFSCEFFSKCESEKLLEFSKSALSGLFAMGTLILGYIAGSQSK